MPKPHECPKCQNDATVMCLTSDDNIVLSTWLYCLHCKYDQRNTSAEESD